MNETRPSTPGDAVAPPAPTLAEPPSPAPAPHVRRVLTARNYAWIAGAAIVLFLGLRYLGPVLTPFLIGAILAYLGTHRALGEGLDALDEGVARVDVDAGLAIGK